MHERALVSRLAADLLSQLEPGERVSQVALAVSPETDPDVVELAWRSATSDSAVAAVDVLYLTREHWLQCLGCGRHYEGGKLTVCPGCGSDGLIVHPAPEVSLAGWVAEEHT
ncbi:MAG: hydrogenase/urease maturation nickel metallochaperone HypA [Acidimicrobiia bacterium]